jgi:hypothetical protein
MTEYLDISGALDLHLSTMAGLPDVAWENLDYQPVQGVSYLRPTHIPASTNQAALGNSGEDRHDGIYQVDVIAEAGKGKGAAYTLADQVADHFARGTDLTYNGLTVTIRNTPRLTGRTSNGWFIVPVEVQYFAYTAAR